MANLVGYKNAGNFEAGWLGEELTAEGLYDFSVDGGTAGTYGILNIPSGSIILNGYCYTELLCESLGTATIEVGYSGSTAAVIAKGNMNTFTTGGVKSIVGKFYTGASDLLINVKITDANLTAGKCHVVLVYKKA
jgi:hypothetical protein